MLKRSKIESKMSGIRQMGMAVSSPEKAGVGGSTPSLATISFNGLAARPEILHL
jgi:hypothetical protein